MAKDKGRRDIDERLKLDPKLAEEVKKMGDYPLHPIVTKISQKFGAFNLIRNARNKRQVDIESIE